MIKHISTQLKKSRCNKRDYRYIQLKNEMKCMLVQDPESETAAACLHMGAGSLRDPEGMNGLAHFCEHMLFLGTKQFPEENTYAKYITANGG